MYNILYYDSDQFDIEDVKKILDTFKQSVSSEMADKTIALPKGIKLVRYYEEKDLPMKGINQ